jgi:hypothetical protein
MNKEQNKEIFKNFDYYESEIVDRRNSNDLQALDSINLQRFVICS